MTAPESICPCCSARTFGAHDTPHCAACAGRDGLGLVLLSETPSTGYRWLPAELPDDVRFIAEDFIDDPQSAMIGGSGLHLFVLRGPPASRRAIRWRLQKEWESEPVEELELEVEFESHAAEDDLSATSSS